MTEKFDRKKMTLPDKLLRSFSARLSFFILLFTAAIFIVAFSVFYLFSSKTIERNAHTEAENALQIINLQIEKVLRRVEAVPDNLNWVISNDRLQPDAMYGITQDVIRNNPDIYGSAIAFEPHFFKEKGYYFSPYSYRCNDSIKSLQLGNENYDYFTWEWYSVPKKLGHPCWSEPYFDEGGGQMIMCTYSSPIYDNEKQFIGIFTSDISLEWLTNLIAQMKRSEKSYTFMLGKDGTYIVHHQNEKILNQTIFDVAEEMNNPDIAQLGKKMIDGEKGMELLQISDVKSFVFYAPVPHTHWSLGIVLPSSEVFGDLHRSNWILILISLSGLIALFVICSQIINKLTQPLKKFATSAREIAHGDFQAKLPQISSKDEMKELHDSFSYMQSELTNYIADLKQTTSVKEKIESELRIARDIQMGMIPKTFPPFPERKEISLYATLNPAKEVGGDLYDFLMEGDKLFFAIGDVSGKGVPASLFMAVTRSLFRSVVLNIGSPGAVMNLLNASISENNDSKMFVTMFIGVFDLKTGVLQYCNAGHNPPVLVSPDSQCNYLEVMPNIPVGVMEGFEYKEQSITLSDSSHLILYTDGVTEAENVSKELYGKTRLLDVIRNNPKISPRRMIETLIADIETFVENNEPSDDITLLAIEYDKQRTVNNRTLSIFNKMEELNKVAEFAEQLGNEWSLSPTLVMNINLVLEEAISNIILYAYKDKPEEKQIEIVASCNANNLLLTITDSGEAFDPERKEDPDITLSAEERPVGGLGIFLIKQIMNEVEYQRVNGNNVLTMSKKIINK